MAEESLAFLVERLSSPEPADRLLAARELGKRGPAGAPAVPHLVAALTASDPMFRGMAAAALGKIGAPAAVAAGPLVSMLSDPVVPVRFWAADALGRIGVTGPEIRAALEQVAQDEHPLAKAASAAARTALGRLGNSVGGAPGEGR